MSTLQLGRIQKRTQDAQGQGGLRRVVGVFCSTGQIMVYFSNHVRELHVFWSIKEREGYNMTSLDYGLLNFYNVHQ